MATSSGMGIITSCIWTMVNAGARIVAGNTLYGCTFT
ncbi:MAG: hypothetical protein ACTTJ7_07260 [Treponema sp.]